MNARLPRASTLVALLVPMALAGSGAELGQGPITPGLRFTWTSSVLEGQSDAAREHAVRRRSYVQANHPRVSYFPLVDYSPKMNRVTWVADFLNTMEMESTLTSLDEEEGWLALDEQERELFEADVEFHFMLPIVQGDPPAPPKGFWWRRSARADPTELARAIRFARAEAEYVNSKYPSVRMEVYGGVGRDVGRIFWFGEFASPDVWRDIQTRLWADEDYLDLLEGAADLFDPAEWKELMDTTP